MYDSALTGFSLWWIIPIIMIVLCFIMMRGCKRSMMCGFDPRLIGKSKVGRSNVALYILDKRYVSGEINKEEYEEKKSVLTQASRTGKSIE